MLSDIYTCRWLRERSGEKCVESVGDAQYFGCVSSPFTMLFVSTLIVLVKDFSGS